MLVPHTPFACSLVLSALSSPQCRPSERYVGYAYILPYGLAAFQVSLRGIVCVSPSSALQRCLSRPGFYRLRPSTTVCRFSVGETDRFLANLLPAPCWARATIELQTSPKKTDFEKNKTAIAG